MNDQWNKHNKLGRVYSRYFSSTYKSNNYLI